MVIFEDEGVVPVPREKLLRLVEAHLDDTAISQIHHLIVSQRTVGKSGDETIVDRNIDVRGKPMPSQWRLIYRPPELFRWEILESEGPWTKDDYIENRYSEVPGGTRVSSRGNLRIAVLPFFLPQKRYIRQVVGMLDQEDLAYLQRPG